MQSKRDFQIITKCRNLKNLTKQPDERRNYKPPKRHKTAIVSISNSKNRKCYRKRNSARFGRFMCKVYFGKTKVSNAWCIFKNKQLLQNKKMSKLSKNLKKLRNKLGLTQEHLSAMIGIKRRTYSAYEEYRAEPNIKTIIALSVLFAVSIDDLLTKEL